MGFPADVDAFYGLEPTVDFTSTGATLLLPAWPGKTLQVTGIWCKGVAKDGAGPTGPTLNFGNNATSYNNLATFVAFSSSAGDITEFALPATLLELDIGTTGLYVSVALASLFTTDTGIIRVRGLIK